MGPWAQTCKRPHLSCKGARLTDFVVVVILYLFMVILSVFVVIFLLLIIVLHLFVVILCLFVVILHLLVVNMCLSVVFCVSL